MTIRYFRGYPRRHLRQSASGMAITIGCIGPLLVLATTAAVLRTLSFLQTRSWLDLAAALFCLVFTIVWALAIPAGIRDSLVSRVVPYFERRTGASGMQPFVSGLALARNSEQLDLLASSLGIATLSSFGYHDDRAGETPHWHEPADGLRVVTQLREAIESGVVSWPDASEICSDLAAVEQALTAAETNGIRFCFLLRSGRDQFISGHEMSKRAGSFW